MSDFAIRVEGLGKAYRLGAKAERSDTLVGAISNLALAPLRNLRRLQRLNTFSTERESDDILWALKDVSFEVKEGEVVGFVGRNGAGKSTLLKVLSRITDPTEGRVTIRGRVSSLLEVGTGFHPELTGRENIYMNGTILGMKKRELDRKFDEIVDFSGVERFLDTPVKRYSSGMKVRLAFSVAAHLEPELLIVDEVLAVGDAEFQRKCLGKMQDVAGGGRTVLFVSHNMGAVQNLCTRAIAMRNGRTIEDGPPGDVVQNYLASLASGAISGFSRDNPERRLTGAIEFIAGRLLNERGLAVTSVVAGAPLTIEANYANSGGCRALALWFTVINQTGLPVFKLSTTFFRERVQAHEQGKILCHIPRVPLPAGSYVISLAVLADGVDSDVIPAALEFEISSSVFHESGIFQSFRHVASLVDHSWTHIDQPIGAAPMESEMVHSPDT
jgi:lipopolysaccharide transport system ATP-binding protein